jgi:hypothetical protein
VLIPASTSAFDRLLNVLLSLDDRKPWHKIQTSSSPFHFPASSRIPASSSPCLFGIVTLRYELAMAAEQRQATGLTSFLFFFFVRECETGMKPVKNLQ